MRWGTYASGSKNTWKYDTNTTATKGTLDPLGNLTLNGRARRYGISLCRIVDGTAELPEAYYDAYYHPGDNYNLTKK